MRLGIIARSDNTGLGNQTRELVNMLNPDKVLLVDSTAFNGNKQHPEWYSGYNVTKTSNGMPTNKEYMRFLQDIDVVLSCETFYSTIFIDMAKKYNVKTILQYNYELFGHMTTPNLTLPDVLLSPSLWNIDIVKEKFGNKTKVIHLPPPTTTSIFDEAREINTSKTHNRILHIAGKKAAKDRNGTESILEMMRYSKSNFELVIKTQTKLDIKTNNSRVKIDTDNIENRANLYAGYDAMLLPRRYAGLCLPMNEALISGLPVFMTDISPNNIVLPSKWLIPSEKIGSFQTKSMVDIYSAEPEKFARIIDDYVDNVNKEKNKQQAIELGFSHFAVENLKDKYLEVINSL
jgi:hypothetical protein